MDDFAMPMPGELRYPPGARRPGYFGGWLDEQEPALDATMEALSQDRTISFDYSLWHTGGGCLAVGVELGELGHHMLITDLERYDDGHVDIGLYPNFEERHADGTWGPCPAIRTGGQSPYGSERGYTGHHHERSHLCEEGGAFHGYGEIYEHLVDWTTGIQHHHVVFPHTAPTYFGGYAIVRAPIEHVATAIRGMIDCYLIHRWHLPPVPWDPAEPPGDYYCRTRPKART